MRALLLALMVLFAGPAVADDRWPDNTGGAGGTSAPSAWTEVRSIYIEAGALVADGTNCADIAKASIGSSTLYTHICTDSDSSTLYGHVVMPDGWDGGTVTFELEYAQTAADTSAINSDIACKAAGAGEAFAVFGSEQAIDDTNVTGSGSIDHTTSSAVTCGCTTSCLGGDTLLFQWQLDATGTTTAVATLHFMGVKIEYTSTIGD